MPGYRNRVITLRFPELAEEGDDIHVVIRNPRLMPVGELQSLAGSRGNTGEEGATAEDGVTDEDVGRGFALYARLVIGWRVYDATSTDEDQPLLPLPATPELVGKLPQEILNRITEEVSKANPPQTPESQEGTGNPS